MATPLCLSLNEIYKYMKYTIKIELADDDNIVVAKTEKELDTGMDVIAETEMFIRDTDKVVKRETNTIPEPCRCDGGTNRCAGCDDE